MRSIYLTNKLRDRLIKHLTAHIRDFMEVNFDRKAVILKLYDELQQSDLYKRLIADPYIEHFHSFSLRKGYHTNLLNSIGNITTKFLECKINMPATADYVEYTFGDENQYRIHASSASYYGPSIRVDKSESPAITKITNMDKAINSLYDTIHHFDVELQNYKNTKQLIEVYPSLETLCNELFQNEIEHFDYSFDQKPNLTL